MIWDSSQTVRCPCPCLCLTFLSLLCVSPPCLSSVSHLPVTPSCLSSVSHLSVSPLCLTSLSHLPVCLLCLTSLSYLPVPISHPCLLVPAPVLPPCLHLPVRVSPPCLTALSPSYLPVPISHPCLLVPAPVLPPCLHLPVCVSPPCLTGSLSHGSLSHIPQGMRVLVDARDKLGIGWQCGENEKQGLLVMSWEGCGGVPGVEPGEFQLYVTALGALWADAGIQTAYSRRAEFQLVSVRSGWGAVTRNQRQNRSALLTVPLLFSMERAVPANLRGSGPTA